jgi:hypothetical protein
MRALHTQGGNMSSNRSPVNNAVIFEVESSEKADPGSVRSRAYRELGRCSKIFSGSCFRLRFATTLRASQKFYCLIL